MGKCTLSKSKYKPVSVHDSVNVGNCQHKDHKGVECTGTELEKVNCPTS